MTSPTLTDSERKLLQSADEKTSKLMEEHEKQYNMHRETPLEYNPAQHTNTPRFSITISGPSTWSLSATDYHFSATLHYDAYLGSQPVTFNEWGCPIDTSMATFLGTYLLYQANGAAVASNFPEINPEDEALPVCSENGFSTIGPGESITRELSLQARFYEVKVGARYELLMPRGCIGWWDWGAMEKHENDRVSPLEVREDRGGALMIPRSNSVEIVTVD